MKDLSDLDDEDGEEEKEPEGTGTIAVGTYEEGEWVNSDLLDFGPPPDRLSRAEGGLAQQHQHSDEDIDDAKGRVNAKVKVTVQGGIIDEDSE